MYIIWTYSDVSNIRNSYTQRKREKKTHTNIHTKHTQWQMSHSRFLIRKSRVENIHCILTLSILCNSNTKKTHDILENINIINRIHLIVATTRKERNREREWEWAKQNQWATLKGIIFCLMWMWQLPNGTIPLGSQYWYIYEMYEIQKIISIKGRAHNEALNYSVLEQNWNETANANRLESSHLSFN